MLFHLSSKHFPNICKQSQKKERQLPKKRKLTDSLPLSFPSPSNVAFDHAYASKADVASKAKVSANQVAHLKQKVKALKQRVRRRDVRIRNLSALFNVLQKQKLVTDEQHDMLENNFSGVGKTFSKIRFKMPKVHMGTGTALRQNSLL